MNINEIKLGSVWKSNDPRENLRGELEVVAKIDSGLGTGKVQVKNTVTGRKTWINSKRLGGMSRRKYRRLL